jgi:type IV secretion system protein VirB4
VLANTLPRAVAVRLQPWVEGGQFGFLFDNPTDNISFAQFQCFDFEGMKDYPQVLEPLLFYILHRANAATSEPSRSHVFKAFFIDEAWVFFRNRSIHAYITRALRTWRKRNGAVILIHAVA